jgi:hypothetical protein
MENNMAEEKQTPEQKAKKREDDRKAALANLKGNVGNFAAVYLIENSEQFGKADSSAAARYVFSPSAQSDEFMEALSAPGFGGKRYTQNTGQVLEHYMAVAQDALMKITVKDVYGLMGSKDKGDDTYISDLPKEKIGAVLEEYLQHLAKTRAAYALNEDAKTSPSKLEKILAGKEK